MSVFEPQPVAAFAVDDIVQVIAERHPFAWQYGRVRKLRSDGSAWVEMYRSVPERWRSFSDERRDWIAMHLDECIWMWSEARKMRNPSKGD